MNPKLNLSWRQALSSCVFASVTALVMPAVAAAPSRPVSPDLSGTYDCTGQDSQEGPYTAVVTLTSQSAHSVGRHRAYDFKMEVPGYGTYLGQAVGAGAQLAIHFALTDPATHDFGTGLAQVFKRQGRLGFSKFYYEPEFKGGNHGTEECLRR